MRGTRRLCYGRTPGNRTRVRAKVTVSSRGSARIMVMLAVTARVSVSARVNDRG